MISTCARDIAVHMKITPHALPFPRLLTVSWNVMAPNRSTAMDLKTGAGPILWMGKGAIFCISLSLTVHNSSSLRPVPDSASPWHQSLHGLFCALPQGTTERVDGYGVEGEQTLHHKQLSGISWPFLPQPSSCTGEQTIFLDNFLSSQAGSAVHAHVPLGVLQKVVQAFWSLRPSAAAPPAPRSARLLKAATAITT